MPNIQSSVGRGGANREDDTRTVQQLLNRHDLTPLRALTVDGDCGPNTIGAIEHFQSKVVGMDNPDGRVDPGGRTLRHLRSGVGGNGGARAAETSGGGASNLSGAAWWRANQGRYPNSRDIQDLEGDFRDKVRRFVDALRGGDATVTVASTRRNAKRAHLMHYSWRVARDGLSPAEVPSQPGLGIEWDHGDAERSRRGAAEMVRLFNMAHIASLRSNHIRGTAIDMNIAWTGDLVVAVPERTEPVAIRDGPRSGAANRALHEVGRLFGVLKLRSDPPHWSHNGR